MIKDIFGKIFLFLPLLASLFAACDDSVTYTDMKEKERSAVNRFVKENGIKIISFAEFVANDSTTDVAKNEYVEIDGVYMQIVRNPKGDPGAFKIKDGDNCNLLVRYYEYNIQDGDTISSNLYMGEPDEMIVKNSSGTYTATFAQGGVMASIYGNSVPTGWLTPLNFLYFKHAPSNLAKVNLIVPHSKGTTTAAMYVYPCLYQITFQSESSFVEPE
jgi:hypothetical protein